MKLLFLSQVGSGATIGNVSAEQIFGGVVLLLVLWLLLGGKMRFEREILREKDLIDIQQETIDKQRETIKALTSRDRESLHLLRELRTAAISRGDLHFSDLTDEDGGYND